MRTAQRLSPEEFTLSALSTSSSEIEGGFRTATFKVFIAYPSATGREDDGGGGVRFEEACFFGEAGPVREAVPFGELPVEGVEALSNLGR